MMDLRHASIQSKVMSTVKMNPKVDCPCLAKKVRPFTVMKYSLMSHEEFNKAHWYVLNSCDKVQP